MQIFFIFCPFSCIFEKKAVTLHAECVQTKSLSMPQLVLTTKRPNYERKENYGNATPCR